MAIIRKRGPGLNLRWLINKPVSGLCRSGVRVTLLLAVLVFLLILPMVHALADSVSIGDIGATVIDTLEFDTSLGVKPAIINVAWNIFAIAYTGKCRDGYLKTVKIGNGGMIDDAVIDTLEFDTAKGIEPDIIHIYGSIFAIAYTGPNRDGFIKTVSISTNGQIGDTVIDTLEFDTATGVEPDIIHISGTVYALAYRGIWLDGTLKTVQIGDNGQIGDTVIDTLKFDTSIGVRPSIVPVAGDIYAIAYTGALLDGFIKTVQIAGNGQITDNIIDTIRFDSTLGITPEIIHIAGDTYAIAYSGQSFKGMLKTVVITGSGQISDAVVDTLVFDTTVGVNPSIVHVTNDIYDIYAIAYQGSGDDGGIEDDDDGCEDCNDEGYWQGVGNGILKTVQIADNGQITNAAVDTMIFDNKKGFEPKIVSVAGNTFAIAYRGLGNDGFIKTVSIAAYTWESYRDISQTMVWGTSENPYDGSYQTVYMSGNGFIPSGPYAVGFYDGDGIKAQTDNVNSGVDGSLSSDYILTGDVNAKPGAWHVVVYDRNSGTPPQTYTECAYSSGYVEDDSFEVTPQAIPEFPKVVAGIVVVGICSGMYWFLKKRKMSYGVTQT